MKLEDIMYLAGLLEGEGSFVYKEIKREGYSRYKFRVTMQIKDEDIVNKAKQIYEKSSICYVKSRDIYSWQVQKNEDAIELMEILLPYMGKRRTLKIKECIDLFNSIPKNYCQKLLHEMTEENIMLCSNGINTVRRCRECFKNTQREYKDRKTKGQDCFDNM